MTEQRPGARRRLRGGLIVCALLLAAGALVTFTTGGSWASTVGPALSGAGAGGLLVVLGRSRSRT